MAEELARSKGEIEQESKKVYESLKMEVEKLSSDVAQKILRRSI